MVNKKIKPGDILLCYSSDSQAKAEELQSGYSHVAICTRGFKVVESSASGIKITDVDTLLEEYGHIAVIRDPEGWSPERLLQLDCFVQRKIGNKFNGVGMFKLRKRKLDQKSEEMKRVEGYFAGTYKLPSHDRNVYFCSEFIVAAFVEVGIIHESASIILSPDTLSPEDIGQDNAFGFFVGYLIPYEGYEVPENDMFQNWI